MHRTTLALDERILERIRARARMEKRTVQDCVNELLRIGLEHQDASGRQLPPWPSFDLGGALIDLGDRDALYDILDRDDA